MPSSRRATTVSPSRGYRPETDHRNPKNAEQRPRSAPILGCQMPSALMQGNNTNHVQTTKRTATIHKPERSSLKHAPIRISEPDRSQIKLALGARGSGRWHAGFLNVELPLDFTAHRSRIHRSSGRQQIFLSQYRKLHCQSGEPCRGKKKPPPHGGQSGGPRPDVEVRKIGGRSKKGSAFRGMRGHVVERHRKVWGSCLLSFFWDRRTEVLPVRACSLVWGSCRADPRGGGGDGGHWGVCVGVRFRGADDSCPSAARFGDG